MKLVFFLIALYFSNVPQEGRLLVPDDVTAIAIAEAVWLPLYGEGICSKLPFRAYSREECCWEVVGTLEPGAWEINEQGDTTGVSIMEGGVPYIKIDKLTGAILNYSHGK